MEKNKMPKFSLNKRSLKYGTLSMLTIAVVVAIAVLVNVIVNMFTIKWDLTPNKLYTLGDTTKKIVEGVTKEVTVYALYDQAKADSQTKEVDELLQKYPKINSKVVVKYVDTDKDPSFIKKLDPDNVKNIQKGDIVFTQGKKIKVLTKEQLFDTQFDQQTFQSSTTGSLAEQNFSGAIKYVVAEKTPTVYFLEGHDELNVDSAMKTLVSFLQRNNYETKTLNLLTVEKVPADAEIVVMAGPKKDLAPDEKDKLKDFLTNGGKGYFAVDPLDNSPKFEQLSKLLGEFNLGINSDRVKENDSKRFAPNNPYEIIPDLVNNSINSALAQSNFSMVMPKSRSVSELKNTKEYIKVTELMKTSSKAVGESLTGGKETPGPLSLALAVEYTGGKAASRVVLVGNSTFMTDAAASKYGDISANGLYFMANSMQWLQDKKDDTAIGAKTYDSPRLDITQSEANVIAFILVILLPLLILGAGVVIWMRRRHL